MKNIYKYLMISLAASAVLVSCEKNQDFQQVVDKAPGLVYVLSGEGNFNSVIISLKESEADGEFSTEFPVLCNTSVHPAQQVNVVYAEDKVETYNAAKGTSYKPLPKQFLSIANVVPAAPAADGETPEEETEVVLPASASAVVALAENALTSENKVQVSLTGDLTQLEPGKYLVPVTVASESLSGSELYGTYYLAVNAERNLLTVPEDMSDVPGMYSWGKSSWVTSTDLDNNLQVDFQYERMVTALVLTGSADVNSIEYSVDGTTWSQAGTPVAENCVQSGSAYYIPFHDYVNGGKDFIKARYVRLHVNGNVNGVDIMEKDEDTDAPVVYFSCGKDNVLESTLHTSAQFGNLFFDKLSFGLYVSPASDAEITGTVALDNSLVEAFNKEHGTAYATLPEENVSLSGAELTIAAEASASASQAVFTLTGDLSGLTDSNGYVVPFKLSSAAQVSGKRNVVYVLVKPQALSSIIKPVQSSGDMVGSQIANATRKNFTADVSSAASLFDNNTRSYVAFDPSAANAVTIDMKDTYNFSGLGLRCYSYAYPYIEKLEASSDGVTFTDLGTVGEDNYYMNGYQCYSSLYFGMPARYVRVTFTMYAPYGGYGAAYRSIAEIYIYAQN